MCATYRSSACVKHECAFLYPYNSFVSMWTYNHTYELHAETAQHVSANKQPTNVDESDWNIERAANVTFNDCYVIGSELGR